MFAKAVTSSLFINTTSEDIEAAQRFRVLSIQAAELLKDRNVGLSPDPLGDRHVGFWLLKVHELVNPPWERVPELSSEYEGQLVRDVFLASAQACGILAKSVAPQDEYLTLAKWAADGHLKRNQRRVVELLAENAGSLPIADVASDATIGWEYPYDDSVSSLIRELNKEAKLPSVGWRILRHDNEIRLVRSKAK